MPGGSYMTGCSEPRVANRSRARVDDVLDDQHVAAPDIGSQALEDAHDSEESIAEPEEADMNDRRRARLFVVKKRARQRVHHRSVVIALAALLGVVTVGGIASAAGFVGLDSGAGKPTPVSAAITTVTFPAPYANPASFDISWVDPVSQAYYLADKTNDGVDAIDGSTDKFGSVIGAGEFVGSNTGENAVSEEQTKACGRSTGGPNGVLSLTVDGSTSYGPRTGERQETGQQHQGVQALNTDERDAGGDHRDSGQGERDDRNLPRR